MTRLVRSSATNATIAEAIAATSGTFGVFQIGTVVLSPALINTVVRHYQQDRYVRLRTGDQLD